MLLVACATLVACGGRPPPPARGVIERDVSTWEFRRYQEAVDVEVWVPDNPAVAHTASYAHKEAVKRGRLGDDDIVNAFVTRYQQDVGVERALVKFSRRLAQEAGYAVEEKKVKGVRAIQVAGHGETWLLWAAERHIIKIGGRSRETVPEALVEAYGDRYPSRLQPGMLEGPLPPGPDGPSGGDPDEPEEIDPDNPRPDWDRYDPDQVKTPDR